MLPQNFSKNSRYFLIIFLFLCLVGLRAEAAQDSFTITITVVSLPLTPPKIFAFQHSYQKLFSGDAISDQPEFSVKITDDYGLELKSIYFYLNGQKVTDGTAANRGYDYFSSTQERAYYRPKQKLSPGVYTLKVTARNTRGVEGSAELTNLMVAAVAEEAKLLAPPLVYPGIANPEKEPIYFSWKLNKPARIHLYVYNLARNLVWEKIYEEGSEGGNAGYNEVLWNGITVFGRMVENGVYFYQVVEEKEGARRVLGRGRFTVFR